MEKDGKDLEDPLFLSKKIGANSLIFLAVILLLGLFPSGANQQGELNFGEPLGENSVFAKSILIQGNSFFPASNPLSAEEESKLTRKIMVIVTGYSSSPSETDDTPHLTASGSLVREGIVATNILPFGTKIRLPELYKNKIFVVEDRMNSRKTYQIDIWFPAQGEALDFGVKRTYIEIIKEA